MPTTDTPSGAPDCVTAAEQAYLHHDLVRECDAARTAWALDPDPLPAPLHGRAGFLLAHFLYRLGQFHHLLAHGPQAVDRLLDSGDWASACQVMRWMALGGAEVGAFEVAIAAARRGMALSHHNSDRALHVLLSNALAACFERMGDPWQAERLLREALIEADDDGGDVPRFVTLNNLTAVALAAYYLLRDGDAPEDATEAREVLDRVRHDATRGLRLAERIGDPFYRVYIEANLGDVLGFLGQHDAARIHLQRALELAQDRGFTTLVLRVQCSLGELALETRQTERARDRLLPLVQSLADHAPTTTVMRSLHALYRAHRQLGEVAPAIRCLERYQQLDRRRTLQQLRAQARNLVTRAEVERAYRDARVHREHANAMTAVAALDTLTGLTSRWGLEQRLRAWPDTVPLPLAVALLDLDNFKPINDRFGHAAGDTVLAEVAALLKQELRQHDVIARLGGDEFAIVLPGTDREQAVAVLERIGRAVAGLCSAAIPGECPLRLSVGLAMMTSLWNPDQPLGEWLGVVDEALYQSKRLGGDRVTVAEP